MLLFLVAASVPEARSSLLEVVSPRLSSDLGVIPYAPSSGALLGEASRSSDDPRNGAAVQIQVDWKGQAVENAAKAGGTHGS